MTNYLAYRPYMCTVFIQIIISDKSLRACGKIFPLGNQIILLYLHFILPLNQLKVSLSELHYILGNSTPKLFKIFI